MIRTNRPTLPVVEFTGINNKIDPETLGLGGWTMAINIDLDSTGKHAFTRDGQVTLSNTAYRGAFGTLDMRRVYAVDATGNLVLWNGSASTLRAGFVGYPYWTQIGNTVFAGNENQCWRIGSDNRVSDNAITQPGPLTLSPVNGTLPPGQYRFVQVAVIDGVESAPSLEMSIVVDGTKNIKVDGTAAGNRIYVAPADSTVFQRWCDVNESTVIYAQVAELLAEELRTNNLLPMPAGRCLASYQGALHVSLYDVATDTSAIFRSLSYWWDLADLTDFIMMPGEVRAMYGLPTGLIVATDRQVGAIVDGVWQPFCDYGVPPGQAIAPDVKIAGQPAQQCWIWTHRGVLKALPFEEVTPQFSPPVGNFVGTTVVRKHGDERLIATLSPFGDPDNTN